MMIESFAERAAISLKEINPEKTTSVEIMKYGIIMSFNGFSVAGLSLLGGWLGGHFTETLYTLVAFGIFRFFSGGFHFESALKCIIFSTTLMIALPYIPVYGNWTLILTAASLVLTAILAPSGIENQTRIPEKYFPLLKVISILIVISNFFLVSSLLAKILFTQSILLVKLKGVKK
ncbi:accessory gene regulator B family protein [Paenibacillus sp. sptzw28]|uniref:accessory gene regulator ArgB-like protein n=1 Tax=Paenibacillus sp. sptzw28 TaxID=715179 RepID=UPI001C6E35A7|nr:accessory gene regulator B family protein [Paenibacillus sp. sptzw28]QYR22677.1 accessory gene regulator B family protein [Paenibacillus sp. sptzw28]